MATICREPVNSMTLELWQELQQVQGELEADPDVRGVIWVSGLKRDVFTAGNDLKELHAPSTSRSRHRAFWIAQTTFLARLCRSPLVTIAAIRGACPAGGCCMALACDVRVATDTCTMGLNEVALGIPVPDYWAQLMARVIGTGAAAGQLQFARMASASEAKQLRLIDQVSSAPELLPTAEALMAAALKLPDYGRHITKARMNNKFAVAWESQAEIEAAEAWAMLETAPMVAAIGGVLARLTKRAKPVAKL